MGDAKKDDLRVSFDSRLKLRFLGSQITTDAGLLAYREFDEALGLTEMSADNLQDSRLGQNKQHGLVPLLRQSVYSRLAGYEDVNDAERLSVILPCVMWLAAEQRWRKNGLLPPVRWAVLRRRLSTPAATSRR